MKLARLYQTVRHLKPQQVFHRLFVMVRPRFVGSTPVVSRRSSSADWVAPAQKSPTMLGPRDFRILNQDISVNQSQDWNDEQRDKLLLYHLHYLDDLTAVDAASRTEWHTAWIDKWIDDNPPMAGNGWEPYPLSLRLVNCIKWGLAGNVLSERQLESLWIQARVMNQSVEYHLQANHLMANAKALYYAGCFFTGGEADQWLNRGIRLLSAQIAEQILDDGAHFERSPMYQAVVLDDMLDIINIGRHFEVDLPAGIEDVVEPMYHWLTQMTHPDREPAYFNDSVAASAVSIVELQAYAERLEFSTKVDQSRGLYAFENSGYARFNDGTHNFIVDFGEIGPDFQPGHAHCDCLSFELSAGDRRVLVNTGISTYNNNERRRLERSTAAHNTVSIAGREQSEVWGAFRVGRRARPFDIDLGENHLGASHDGYRQSGVTHRRQFEFFDDKAVIMDWLQSGSGATGTAHFHCHPDFAPRQSEQGVLVDGLRLEFENANKVELVPYEYCLGFNKRQAATKICVTFEDSLKTTIDYEDSLHIR